MLIKEIKISNHPVYNYERIAECYRLDFEEPFGEKALLAYFVVKCFKESSIELKELQKRITLKADNTTPVDGAGKYILNSNGEPDWENPAAVMGEYDFILAAKNQGADMSTLIEEGAKQADLFLQRFDK